MPSVSRLRPRLVAVSALLAGLLLATACSPTSGASSPTPSAEAPAKLLPEAEGKTQYPLTLTSPWGETILPERPERISLTGAGSEIELLAVLGVNPTGTPDTAGDPDQTVYPWALELLSVPVESTWAYGATEAIESIAASRPHLIVADNSVTEEIYAKLSAIAPVVYVGEHEYWVDQIQLIGTALDLSNAARQAIADDEAYWSTFRTQHPAFQQSTITYFIVWGGQAGALVGNTPGSTAETNLANWGFKPNPQLAAFKDVKAISNELSTLLDADVLVGLDSSTGEFADLVKLPLFQQLDAVKNQRFITLAWGDDDNTFTHNGVPATFRGTLVRRSTESLGRSGHAMQPRRSRPSLRTS